jgi:hypothetical protein
MYLTAVIPAVLALFAYLAIGRRTVSPKQRKQVLKR